MATGSPQETITTYRAAYERRHGKPAPEIRYERGWYIFDQIGKPRYRRARLVAMKEFLLEQARQIESLR